MAERSGFLFGDRHSPTAARRDRIRLGVLALVTLLLVALGRIGFPTAEALWPLWTPVLYMSRTFSRPPRAPKIPLVLPPASSSDTAPAGAAEEKRIPALGVLPISGNLLIGAGSAEGVRIGDVVLAPPSASGEPLRYVGRVVSIERTRARVLLPRDPASLLPVSIEGLGADGFLARGTGRGIRCLYLTGQDANALGYDSRVHLAPVALPEGSEREVIEVGRIRLPTRAEEAFYSTDVSYSVDPARLEWVILR